MEDRRVQVFVSYARKNGRYLEEFLKSIADLRRNQLLVFADRAIQSGQRWERVLKFKLETADIVVVLVSNDFVNSDYCYRVEFGRALELENAGECKIFPVNLEPVDLSSEDPLCVLQYVPGRPISEQRSRKASAWKEVAKELRACAEDLRISGLPSRPRRDLWRELPQNVILLSEQRRGRAPSRQQRGGRQARSHEAPAQNPTALAEPGTAGWQYILRLLQVTRLDGTDRESFAMSAGALHEALGYPHPLDDSSPARAEEVARSLRRALSRGLNPAATQASVQAACETGERLQGWLLDILTSPGS